MDEYIGAAKRRHASGPPDLGAPAAMNARTPAGRLTIHGGGGVISLYGVECS
jgi:hypothetical protein